MRTVERTVEEVYQARKNRLEHPDGKFDSGGRWYPSDEERCSCCDNCADAEAGHPVDAGEFACSNCRALREWEQKQMDSIDNLPDLF